MKALSLLVLVFSFIAFGSGLSGGPGSSFAQQQDEQEENIRFLWAFGAIKKEGTGPRPVAITGDTVLKSGDQIKIFVKLKKACFLYIIYYSSQGEVHTLFPYRFDKLSIDYRLSGEYYIPEGDGWFELDDQVGEEKFYLLASAQRLHGLERFINNYETSDQAGKPELARKILGEIRKLRWRYRKFKVFAERPVNIMGHLRGTEKAEEAGTPDVAGFAIEISAKDFYSRTFTIEHQ